MKFFNDPLAFNHQRSKSRRAQQKREGRPDIQELGLEVILEEVPWRQNLKQLTKTIGKIKHIVIGSQNRFVMAYPVGFRSRDGRVSGKIDFGLHVKYEMDVATPRNMSLGFIEESLVTEFKCSQD